MRCEVCDGTPVTARLETPKGSYLLCWPCERLAEVLIRNRTRADHWDLIALGYSAARSDEAPGTVPPSAVLNSMLDRSAS